MSEYPEHDKLRAISDKSQAIGEFIDWLISEREPNTKIVERVILHDYHTTDRHLNPLPEEEWERFEFETDVPLRKSIQDLLAEYFEIDRNKLNEEKLKMFEEIRNVNQQSTKR